MSGTRLWWVKIDFQFAEYIKSYNARICPNHRFLASALRKSRPKDLSENQFMYVFWETCHSWACFFPLKSGFWWEIYLANHVFSWIIHKVQLWVLQTLLSVKTYCVGQNLASNDNCRRSMISVRTRCIFFQE